MSDVSVGKQRRAALARRKALEKHAQKEAKRVKTLITPEGAALNLRIASAGERAGAFLLDFAIQIVSIILVILGISIIAGSMGMRGWQVAGAVATVIIFFIRNFYFIFFEIGRRAATPGKRALGLRVAARNGGRLKSNAVIVRNFMRELEVFVPLSVLASFLFIDSQISAWINLALLVWSGIFLLFPLFNREKMRAGDLIAGTIVVHAPKVQLLKDITTTTASPEANTLSFTPEQLNVYGIHELHVLEDVLRQSTPEIRKTVAERIQKKIAWEEGPMDDLKFLEGFYTALRKHLEQRMLFGERKADKFDKR
jgi:uncharacterized RDD family membrane protein YckC